jgi:hypothetical protein
MEEERWMCMMNKETGGEEELYGREQEEVGEEGRDGGRCR